MRRATFLGGQNDGDIWDWRGHRVLLPVRPSFSAAYMATPDTLPAPQVVTVESYTARQDDDGRWWYVRDDLMA